MAKIIIRRKKSNIGCIQKHDVYFMNTHVGVLKNGGEITVPVEAGKHTIYFRSKMRKLEKMKHLPFLSIKKMKLLNCKPDSISMGIM